MRSTLGLASIAVAIGTAVACSSSDAGVAPVDADGGVPGTPITGDGTGAAGKGLATGLPCDVQALIENRCITCHDGNTSGAPRLLDYADLVAPSKVDPAKSRAQLALTRLKSTTSPMPPPPAAAPDQDEIEAVESWVILGTPKNPATCTDPPPLGDGGASRSDAGTTTQCTSGKTWTGGNTGSALMHPGRACNACHQVSGGPNLHFGGTVYPTSHEPDDCNGVAPRVPPLTVILTDSKAREVTATVNEAGNFEVERGAKLTPPFKARVTDGVKTRAMMGSVTSGDCNSCHTVAGANGAPGRILAP